MLPSDSSSLSSLTSVPASPLERSSSPLSFLSRSPSPPVGYLFTPPPSQDAGENMPRPRKRRKIERSDRTTRYLDLTEDTAQSIYDRNDSIDTLLHALRKRRKIVVIAGAGISVTAGIPDFRSSNGLFAGLQREHKLKGGSGKQLFDASVYKDATSTSQFHDMVCKLSKMSKRAKPTAFHLMLARLANEGRLLRLYTQNVDGLETQMQPLQTEVPLPHKGPWPQTVQLHGGLDKMMCQKCREILDFDPALFDGEETPTCPQCRVTDEIRTNDLGRRSHGIGRLRPRIVLYNEQNPDEEAIGAVSAADMRTRPDAIVVVGTSMKIPGVRRIVSEMCKIVRDRREGTTIWINPDPEPTGPQFENCWDLIVKGGSDEVARMVALRHWEDPNMEDPDVPTEYTDSDVERVNTRQGELKVNIPLSPLKRSIEMATTAVRTPPRSRSGHSQEIPNSKSSGGSAIRLKLKVGAKSEEAERQKTKQQLKVQVSMPAIAKSTKSTKNKADVLKAQLESSTVASSKQQETVETGLSRPPKTKNPASDGRKLAEVLGKENVEKNRKSKTAYKKKERAKLKSKSNYETIEVGSRPRQTKIAAKVTKAAGLNSLPQVCINVPTKKGSVSPKKEVRHEHNDTHDYNAYVKQSKQHSVQGMNMGVGAFRVMHQSHNDSGVVSTPDMTSGGTTPGGTPDPQTPTGSADEVDQGRRSVSGCPLRYDRRETVSPKGNVPNDMVKLLN